MILDKNAMFADGLAYNGTPTVIDLGSVRPGPGRPIKVFVQGSSTLAGATGVVVTDGATDTAGDALITHIATLAGKIVEFELPSDTARYVKVALAGSPSAGSWSAGIVLPGVQTNG